MPHNPPPRPAKGAADVLSALRPMGGRNTGHPCYTQGKGPGGDTPAQSRMEL